jgi:membrane protease YdiL (CAAX protease family)
MQLDDRDDATVADAASFRTLPRLSLGRAIAALGAAFVLAQLFGKIAADIARAVTHGKAASLSAPVVIPSMLASELGLLGVALVIPLLSGLTLREALGLHAAKPRVYVAVTLGTVMLGPLGDRLMSLFSAAFPKLTLGVVPALHDLAQQLPFVWLWPSFALLPGLSEELLFRGVLQRAIYRPRLAIAVSGCAFALFHVDPVHVVGVLPLGLFLAWSAQRSSTLVSIVAHVLNNSIAVISIQNDALDMGFGSEQPLPLKWVAASLVLFLAAAWLVWRDTLSTPSAAPT